MKRLLFVFELFILSVSAFAASKFERSNRIFELGVDVDVALSNNYFAVTDFLKKEIVIDLNEISTQIDENRGLELDASVLLNAYTSLNLKNGVSVSLSNGVEAYGMGGISKDLFNFLGDGNSLNETIKVDGNLEADIFYYITNDIAFDYKGFRIGLGPSLYLPIMHMETSDFNVTFNNDEDGSVYTRVGSELRVNSCVNLDKDTEDTFTDAKDYYTSFMTGWGFDLNMTVEHQLLNTLAGRLYMRLPIVPGQLDNYCYSTYEMTYTADDLFDVMNSGGASQSEFGDFTYMHKNMKICRPFRTGGELAWRPFGKCMRFGALLGFGVKYPWTYSARGYLEYNLLWEASLFNILGVKLSSGYLKELYVHQAGFMINARVIEIDFGVSAQGGSFEKSLMGSGAGLFVGVKCGW